MNETIFASGTPVWTALPEAASLLAICSMTRLYPPET